MMKNRDFDHCVSVWLCEADDELIDYSYCIDSANRFAEKINEKIEWSKEYPPEKSIKILDYSYSIAEEAIHVYCNMFDLDVDYYPDDDDIDPYMENPYVDDFDEDLYFRLAEKAVEDAIEAYKKEKSEEIKGYDILESVKDKVLTQTHYQKNKLKFITEALNNKKKRRKTLSDFIIHEDKDKVLSIMGKHLRGRKGKGVAFLIIVLQKIGYLQVTDGNRESFFDSIREHFNYEIGSKQSINDYLRKNEGQKMQKMGEFAKWSDKEIEEAVKRFREI